MRVPILGLVLVLGLSGPAGAIPTADGATEKLGGRLEATVDGKAVALPTLKTAIHARISGDLAIVEVEQTFLNPGDAPVNATYLFPLNRMAAVHRMVMRIGDEVVEAQIKRKQEAQATFETAKSEGKAAALLTQHRPNMFTQDIANLMPGLPVTVTIHYVQPVPKVDGAYQLVIPTVVGPRFTPPPTAEVADHGPNGTPVIRPSAPLEPPPPAYPPVSGLHIPALVEEDRLSLSVDLVPGLPLREADSPTHRLVRRAEGGVERFALARGRAVDNRDFVLEYSLAGERTEAGLLAHHDGAMGYFSLLVEPPAAPRDDQVPPREMVFLLDASGSMHGLPITASKTLVRESLRRLRPEDTFRIVRFSDEASAFTDRPLRATPADIARGIRYLDSIVGEGGTMMSEGVRMAMANPPEQGRMRIIHFLTDGYIGNELEVVRLIREQRHGARLFAFGVGSGVNRYLLDEMGRAGQGTTRYLDPSAEEMMKTVRGFAERTASPVLSDIRIDWGELAVEQVTPAPIPDLFGGDAVRIQGRYTRPGRHTVTVRGMSASGPVAIPLTVTLPGPGESAPETEAVRLTWARSVIADLMHEMAMPPPVRPNRLTDFEVSERVAALGLEHGLQTRWTSFVAVSRKIYNQSPGATPTVPVPLPMVKGVSEFAYPPGSGTPEPEGMIGLAALALGLLWVRQRRRRLGR